ncbi:Protein TTP1 [Kluyveromyces marxianus]
MNSSLGRTISSKWIQFLHYFTRRARVVKKHNCVILAIIIIVLIFSLSRTDDIKDLFDLSESFGSDSYDSDLSSSDDITKLLPGASDGHSDADWKSGAGSQTGATTVPAELKNFYNEVTRVLNTTVLAGEIDSHKPEGCDLKDTGVEDTDKEKLSHLTEEYLLKCLSLPEDKIKELKEGHSTFKKYISEKLMPIADSIKEKGIGYKGQGITIVGGGKYTLMALPTIKSIRMNSGVKLKNTLPIEIVIPPLDEGDRGVCETIIPSLDPTGLTKCVYLSDYIDRDILKHVRGYQLKSLSLLISSFEKTLLLDADNYVVNSIDKFFDTSIFKDTGMILWPDYWRRVHSPRVYDIADIGIDRRRVRFSADYISNPKLFDPTDASKSPFHDLEGAIPDGGTESGQLLVDKTMHLDTIILALYYNYNGPSYYYPLLGQHLAGEGDKDTFILAATALKHRYYQVRTPVKPQGYWGLNTNEVRIHDDKIDKVDSSKKSFRGTAMIQHDYVQDKELDSVAGDFLREVLQEKEKSFRLEWIKTHKDDFKDMNEQDALKKASENNEISNKFWESMKGKYTVNDFFSFFKMNTPVFVHSHLPKYDPWELAMSQDFMYDGKKSEKNPEYHPEEKGHFRIYSSTFKDMTNYDLELANWKIFETVLCKVEDNYKKFSYLSKVIDRTENPVQSVKEMCTYISERVEYLKSSTWENSIS